MPSGLLGLLNGIHTIYFFATDGSDATSINPLRPDEGFSPEASTVIGGINAYQFLVRVPQVIFTTSMSGRVTTPSGSGLRNAIVSLTDSNQVTRTVTTSAFGFYTFDQVQVGETYTVNVTSKRYRFSPRQLTVSGQLTNVDFVGQE